MAETADDLSTPLGQKTVRAKRRLRLPFTGTQALAVPLGLFLVIFAGFAIFNDSPFGGEPIVRVALRQPNAAAESPAAAAPAAADSASKPAARSAAPVKPMATRFDRISYQQVLEQGLKVMDATAISLCMDNRLPIVVFNLRTPGNIKRAISGEPIGSLVTA